MVYSIKYLAEVCWFLVFVFFFFTVKVAKYWHRLPGVVNAPSLKKFKVRLRWALTT